MAGVATTTACDISGHSRRVCGQVTAIPVCDVCVIVRMMAVQLDFILFLQNTRPKFRQKVEKVELLTQLHTKFPTFRFSEAEWYLLSATSEKVRCNCY